MITPMIPTRGHDADPTSSNRSAARREGPPPPAARSSALSCRPLGAPRFQCVARRLQRRAILRADGGENAIDVGRRSRWRRRVRNGRGPVPCFQPPARHPAAGLIFAPTTPPPFRAPSPPGQTPTDSATWAIAAAARPCLASSTVCRLNDENVVNPPHSPIMKNARASAAQPARSPGPSSTASAPIANDPATLIATVPHGNPGPVSRRPQIAPAARATLPSAPPNATNP